MSIGEERYTETQNYLIGLYGYMNERLFNGELKELALTMSPDAKNKSLGWITDVKVWKEDKKDGGMYELNLSAQFLNRPISEIASTLIHQMCHQWARENGFKDTARSGSFHNKLFKKVAEEHGLNTEYVNGRGWANTTLNEIAERLLEEYVAHNPPRLIYREMPVKPKRIRDVSIRKYVCPDCEISVRATKQVNVICGNCLKQMQEEKS